MEGTPERRITTGEFARICGVGKHTLFHYDEIGLLKPEFVNEKGCRFYSVQQTYAFDIIGVLKQTGTPLKEIGAFLENRNASALKKLLQEKLGELEHEQRKIERMRNFLNHTLELTEDAVNGASENIRIERCEEMLLFGTDMDPEGGDKEFVRKLTVHRKICEERQVDLQSAVWTIIGEDRFLRGEYYPNYIGNQVEARNEELAVRIKPAGLYAITDHRGPYETMPETYEKIKTYLGGHDLKICGDAYSVDLISYLAEKNPESYVLRIWIEVRREKAQTVRP